VLSWNSSSPTLRSPRAAAVEQSQSFVVKKPIPNQASLPPLPKNSSTLKLTSSVSKALQRGQMDPQWFNGSVIIPCSHRPEKKLSREPPFECCHHGSKAQRPPALHGTSQRAAASHPHHRREKPSPRHSNLDR